MKTSKNMDFINTNIFGALLLGGLFCVLGNRGAQVIKNKKIAIICTIGLFLLALPALLSAVYYLHLFEPTGLYIEFRAMPYSEFSAAFVGSWVGFSAAYWLPLPLDKLRFSFLPTFVLIIIPFLKPILKPIRYNLADKWSEDVCLQTSASTCGAAALATIFRYYGDTKTESEIAKAAHSCASGTEIWYLIRYAKANGLAVSYSQVSELPEVQPPAILGTTLSSGVGHFVVLLGHDAGEFRIGDPLTGVKKYTAATFGQDYKLNQTVYSFRKIR